MLKNNKGITLITLVIVIIVLVILTSIFVATSLKALNETGSSETQNQIHAIEEAISVRYASYLKSDGNVSLVGSSPTWSSPSECVDAIMKSMDVTNLSAEDVAAKRTRISNEIARDYEKYVKMIGSGDATLLGIEQLSTDNVFVVDYYTSKVYGPIK